MALNKTELVEIVAEQTGLSKAKTGEVVDAIVSSITKELTEGGSVRIPALGTFSVRESAARKGRNPQTGEEIEIPKRNNPKFSAGKPLKDAVR